MCRVREIHQTAGAARYPNCSILAKEIEVTPRTILRDLNFRGDQRVLAERDHVALGVDQTRQQRLPAQINHLGRFALLLRHACGRCRAKLMTEEPIG